jgi:phenylacetate-CoA ligase
MTRIGCPPGVSTGFLWGHHLDPVASDSLRDRIRTLVNNSRWYDCFRASEERFEEYHRDLQRWRPVCLVAYASALAPLAQVAARGKARPAYPVGRIVTGAEKLDPHERELVEEVFDTAIHERYGSRDVGLIGFQLEVPASYHFDVDWPNVFVEPMVEDSEAPILATKLHGDAMPMIRYRTGDLGRFPSGSNPGHPTFRLEEVMGRDLDRLRLPDGRWFHPGGVPHLMKDFPVRDFRVIQAPNFSITVEVVPDGEFTAADRESILTVLRENLPGLPVEISERQEIPKTKAGKRRPVISHAPQDDWDSAG